MGSTNLYLKSYTSNLTAFREYSKSTENDTEQHSTEQGRTEQRRAEQKCNLPPKSHLYVHPYFCLTRSRSRSSPLCPRFSSPLLSSPFQSKQDESRRDYHEADTEPRLKGKNHAISTRKNSIHLSVYCLLLLRPFVFFARQDM